MLILKHLILNWLLNFDYFFTNVFTSIRYFSLTQGTNSYLVGTETGSRILIDTTGGEVSIINQYVNILKTIFEPKDESSQTPEPPISQILLTHWHPDHTEGIEAVQVIPFYINFIIYTTFLSMKNNDVLLLIIYLMCS